MPVRQTDLFYGDKQPHRSAPPLRAYRKAEKSTPAAFAWESMASWVRHMHCLFVMVSPSSDPYACVRTTARELTVEHIRLCRHANDLARCEALLLHANSGSLYGLDHVVHGHETRRFHPALGRGGPTAVTTVLGIAAGLD